MSEGYVAKILDPAKILNLLQHVPLATGDLGKTTHPMATSRYTKDLLSRKSKNHAGGRRPSATSTWRLGPGQLLRYACRSHAVAASGLHLEETRVSSSLMRGFISKSGKKLRPIFYLPYRQKGTTRMKLAEPPGYAGEEVKFFTTATIDGCSVYIEGSPATPKVSHLNASHVAPIPRGGETEANKLLRVQQKSANMDARISIIKKGAATVVGTQGLHRRHGSRPDADEATLRQSEARASRKRVGLSAVRCGGRSEEWRQLDLLSAEMRNLLLPPKPQGPLLDAMMVIEARECWPGGAGVFRMI